MQLSNVSRRRLTIAKELYLHGHLHSMKKSLSDAILSILNFDYCVETVIKAILVDANVNLERRRGNPKSFDELINDLKGLYPNLGYIPEVISLHKLRNDVQHHSLIPSEQEVSRHTITARSFFDEVCLKVYDGKITFADISLALFIRSKVVKNILTQMEKAFQMGNYTDSVFYAKQATTYHVQVLRHNMNVPHAWHSSFLRHDLERAGLRELGEFIEDTDKKTDWIIDRICLREYYDEISNLLGYISQYGIPVKRETANQDTAELARNVVYDFTTGTQSFIKNHDLERPFIFDFIILDQFENECSVQVGFASAPRVTEASLTLKEKGVEKALSTMNIPNRNGLHSLLVKNLQKGKTHQLFVKVTNEKNGIDERGLTLKVD